jgi:hypothetical protein
LFNQNAKKSLTIPNVKQAFVLADRLKNGPFDNHSAFLAAVDRHGADVAGLPTSEIDSYVGRDPRRLHDYNRAVWHFDSLDLRKCRVWPGMGGRDSAHGYVTDVAELFKTKEPLASRVWEMKRFAAIYSEKFPIIALRIRSETIIDDGYHRAVAIALAGTTNVSAWIGTL